MLIKKVFFLARTKRPEVLHAHLHEGVAIGWVVQKLLFWRRMKLVADFHGSLTKEMVSHAYLGGGFLKKIFQRLEHWIDNRGDAAVTSSWENTEEIKVIRKDGKVETVLDGVNIERFKNLPSKEDLRRKFNLPLDTIVVAYTGALIPNKGIQYFLDAIPSVLRRNAGVHFLIAGFPYDQIAARVEAAEWRDRVTIVSPLAYFDLPKLLSASDIGVDPKDSSVAQASGKMVQYMGAGLPVACFERSNNREYLGDGGAYASEITGEGLAGAITELVDLSERERREKGEMNRDRARSLSYDAAAEQLEKVYQNIV